MRAVVQCVLAVGVVAAVGVSPALPADPLEVDTAAVTVPLASAIESIAPGRDGAVGVAHPVVITFEGRITDRAAAERAVSVRSSPARTGRYEWLDDAVLQWVPDEYWPADSTIMLSVGGRAASFTTGPEVIGVADLSDHTFTVTVDGIAEGAVPLPAPHHLPRMGEDGVLLASMGRPEYPTPVGRYSVLAKDRSVVMDSSSVGIPVTAPDGYRLEVEYAVRITRRGLYVHSAPWAVPAMGVQNVSHGCISLVPAAAQWYFDTVNVGDPVIVQE